MTNEEMMNMMMNMMMNTMSMMNQSVESVPKEAPKTTAKKTASAKPKTTAKKTAKAEDITYDVKKVIATISQNGNYKKKLTLMSWNGGEYKYDLRNWVTNEATGKDEPRKGITFTKDELMQLAEVVVDTL